MARHGTRFGPTSPSSACPAATGGVSLIGTPSQSSWCWRSSPASPAAAATPPTAPPGTRTARSSTAVGRSPARHPIGSRSGDATRSARRPARPHPIPDDGVHRGRHPGGRPGRGGRRRSGRYHPQGFALVGDRIVMSAWRSWSRPPATRSPSTGSTARPAAVSGTSSCWTGRARCSPTSRWARRRLPPRWHRLRRRVRVDPRRGVPPRQPLDRLPDGPRDPWRSPRSSASTTTSAASSATRAPATCTA